MMIHVAGQLEWCLFGPIIMQLRRLAVVMFGHSTVRTNRYQPSTLLGTPLHTKCFWWSKISMTTLTYPDMLDDLSRYAI